MEKVTLSEVEITVKAMAELALKNEKYFSELDAAAGDADFGVSLAGGFKVVISDWEEHDRSSISAFLMAICKVIMAKIGGCSGPIWGTAFMRTSIKSKGKNALSLADMVEMSRSAIEGIMARGGAQLGDKTLLDALSPATDELEKWSNKQDVDMLDAMKASADVATATIESTKAWEAKRGRQAFTGERSCGTPDPGIVAVSMMMQAVVKALKEDKS